MKLWLDAQLPPSLSGWINQQGLELQAVHLRVIWDWRHKRSQDKQVSIWIKANAHERVGQNGESV